MDRGRILIMASCYQYLVGYKAADYRVGILSVCVCTHTCVHWSGRLRGCQEGEFKLEVLFESVRSANKALESAGQEGSKGLRRVILKSFTLNL